MTIGDKLMGHRWVLSIWDCRKCAGTEFVIWSKKPSKSEFKRELARFLASNGCTWYFTLDGSIKDSDVEDYVGMMYDEICANWNSWQNGSCAIYDYCVGIKEYVDGKLVSF